MKSKITKTKRNKVSNAENSLFWSFIGNLPLTLSISLASFGTVSVVLLLLESFTTSLVFGLGLPVAAVAFIITNRVLVPESPGSLRERRLFDVIAILFVIGWGVFNSAYNAQTVYLYRDPGLYNTTARWLMEHDSIVIPSNNPFGDNDQLKTTSNAGVNKLKEDNSRLYTHGQRLLPTITASVGRVTRESAALKTNVLIGSLALLTLYGFIRLFTKPRWAFLATTVMSLSLPMLYFSRDMYTEPLSMLLFFTLLGFLYFAKQTEKLTLWLLGGLIAGATTMTRIDSYLGLAGVMVYLILYLILAKNRSSSIKNVLFFFIGLLVTGVIAWLDLTMLGTAYYRFHESLISKQLLLILGIIIGGAIMVFASKKTKLLPYVQKSINLKKVKILSALLVVIATVFLFARPIIFSSERYYEVQEIGGTESIVAQERKTANTIEYDADEQVILWPAWYLGALICVLGLLGAIILSIKVWEDKSLLLLPFALSFMSIGILYLTIPSITRDHIWASRRILPVIMPGIAFLSAYTLNFASSKRKLANSLVYISVSVVFLVSTLNVSGFFLKERVNSPLLTQVNDFCDTLPDNSSVLLVGIFGLVGVQTVSSYCSVPTVRFIGIREPQANEFQEFYDNSLNNGYVPVVAAFYEDRGLFVEGSLVRDLERVEYKIVEKVFQRPPDDMVLTSKQITLGILNEDGRVEQKLSDKKLSKEIIFRK